MWPCCLTALTFSGLVGAYRALPMSGPDIALLVGAYRTSSIYLCDPDSGQDHNFLSAAAVEFETDEEVLRSVGSAWALLFNVGSGHEGIYSRRLPLGNGNGFDMVVAFERRIDAERYADQLSVNAFPSSTPVEVETGDLLDFCAEGGHTLGLVRRGVLVVPPERAVEEFEWSPGVSEEATAPLESTPEELEAQRLALEAMMGGTGDTEP